MRDKGLLIIITKTVYLRFNGCGHLNGNSYINLRLDNLEIVTTYQYVGSTSAEDG